MQEVIDRTKSIGASDLAAVFNLPPYGCTRQLWYEKRGVEADYPFLGNEHTRRGLMFEPFIAELYTKETGRDLTGKGLSLKDNEHSFITCTLDYVHKDDGTPVEIKCPSLRSFRRTQIEGLEYGYILQLQMQIHLRDSTQGTAVLLCPEIAELTYFDVKRDPQIIEHCIKAEVAFWDEVHRSKKGPGRLEIKDARCHRCTHRNICQGEALADVIPASEDEVVYAPALAPHVVEYFRAKEIRDEADAYYKDVSERIKQAMGKAAVVDTTGARIYNRPMIRKLWDTKKLEAKHPELAQEFKRKTTSMFFRVYPK